MPLLELNRDPDRTTLRRFGFVACAVFAGLGVCAFHDLLWFAAGLGRARIAVGTALLATGVVSGVLSIVRPRANRALYRALSTLAYPIGFMLSYCVLFALFFGIVTPIGLLLRLFGRDALTRRLQPEMASYWVEAHALRARSRYFRQF